MLTAIIVLSQLRTSPCPVPLTACRYNLSRIFFGGFFIRGHPYTMETISFAIRFWSKVTCDTLHAPGTAVLRVARCCLLRRTVC